MNKLVLVLMLGGMLLSTSACEKKEERILPKVDSAARVDIDVAEQSRLEREAFINQAQNEIDELGVRLADFRKKAAEASGKAREKLDQQVLAMEHDQKDVEEKLAILRLAIGEQWKELRGGVSSAIEQFKQSVDKAI